MYLYTFVCSTKTNNYNDLKCGTISLNNWKIEVRMFTMSWTSKIVAVDAICLSETMEHDMTGTANSMFSPVRLCHM